MDTKRAYEAPKLTAWGKVVDLTKVATDNCYGSVPFSNGDCRPNNIGTT